MSMNWKTVRERAELLEPEIRDKLIRQSRSLDIKSNSMSDAIDSAFVWSCTNEWHSYWNGLCLEWVRDPLNNNYLELRKRVFLENTDTQEESVSLSSLDRTKKCAIIVWEYKNREVLQWIEDNYPDVRWNLIHKPTSRIEEWKVYFLYPNWELTKLNRVKEDIEVLYNCKRYKFKDLIKEKKDNNNINTNIKNMSEKINYAVWGTVMFQGERRVVEGVSETGLDLSWVYGKVEPKDTTDYEGKTIQLGNFELSYYSDEMLHLMTSKYKFSTNFFGDEEDFIQTNKDMIETFFNAKQAEDITKITAGIKWNIKEAFLKLNEIQATDEMIVDNVMPAMLGIIKVLWDKATSEQKEKIIKSITEQLDENWESNTTD